MSSMFDFDDSQEIVFQTKTAGKAIIAAKYDVMKDTGDFLFLAHSDGEFAERCQMIDSDLTRVAYNKLANVSDSKMKLVKALHTEWSLRHAKCQDCNCGKNRKFAKSTCEKCADGELDSDSPLCKACRGKNASRKFAKSVCEMCEDGEIDPNSQTCKACGEKGDSRHGTEEGYLSGCRCKQCVNVAKNRNASRKFAKSVCEMCEDGEIDPNSEACKACGAKTAGRHEAAEMSLTPAGDLLAVGIAGGAYLYHKAKDRMKPKDQGHMDDDKKEHGQGHVNIIEEENNKPYDQDVLYDPARDDKPYFASRTANKYPSFIDCKNCPWDEDNPHKIDELIAYGLQCPNCGSEDFDFEHPSQSHKDGLNHDYTLCPKCNYADFHQGSQSCKNCGYNPGSYVASRTANKYIEKRGDKWVILQKGTGKVLSHHDSKEKAEASFRAMMQSKHGSQGDQKDCAECGAPATHKDVRGYLELCDKCYDGKKTASRTTWVTTAHLADGDYCPNCDGEGCAQCGHCSNCGNEIDAYGDHYGMIGCPADEDGRFASGTASNEWPHIELGQHVHGDCPYCSGGGCPTCNDIAPGKNYDGSIHGFNPMGIDDHDMGDMARHDQGHDDWHAMYGDEPCTSEEDCAAKRSRYDNIDNMRDKGEPVSETDLHDALHEQWHRDHGDEPCTSAKDCHQKSMRYKNS